MTDAVTVSGLGKRFVLARDRDVGEGRRWQPQTMAEALARAARRLGRGGAGAELWALREVSFALPPGEVLGLIGRNGSGKSTLLKILSRVIEPTEGRVRLAGRVASLLEVGTGFHPDLSVRQNIFLNGAILGMRRREIAARFDQIVDYAGLHAFIGEPVKHLSSGMYMRLAFAVAAFLESEILIVDEVLAVGDAAFQEKTLGTMRDAVRSGRTVIFVSHNMAAISQLTHRTVVLDQGRVAFDGATPEAVQFYLHQRRQQAGHGVLPADSIVCVHRYRQPGAPAAISALGMAESQSATITPGGALRLELVVQAPQAVKDLRVLYSINSIMGEPLLTGVTGPFVLAGGAQRLELEMRALPLAPGEYDLSISLGRGGWGELKAEYDAFVGFGRFTVGETRHDGTAFGSWLRGWAHVYHGDAQVRLLPAA